MRDAAHYVTMALYFFHIFNHMTVIDEEGQELADVDAARATAIMAARDLASHSIKEGSLNLNHRIEVTTAENVRVLSLTFREAFQVTG